jgi:uncharacterized membrane protein YhaH (DUF805 family)
VHWYTDVLKQYAVFDGRATRPQYWWFWLINTLILEILARGSAIFGLIVLIYGLAVLLPSLGVAIRRLHDTNRSGWWLVIGIIPVIGWIIVIVFLATAGTNGPNSYGPDPQGAGPAPLA